MRRLFIVPLLLVYLAGKGSVGTLLPHVAVQAVLCRQRVLEREELQAGEPGHRISRGEDEWKRVVFQSHSPTPIGTVAVAGRRRPI